MHSLTTIFLLGKLISRKFITWSNKILPHVVCPLYRSNITLMYTVATAWMLMWAFLCLHFNHSVPSSACYFDGRCKI